MYFGAWVEVINEHNETKKFRVVGYDEIFGRSDYISIDSPMARALLGSEVDDEVTLEIESGTYTWLIKEICYK